LSFLFQNSRLTRFEELQDIINKNKSKTNKSQKVKELLEVSGLTESNSEGQGQGQPHIEYADNESDGPLVDQLYRSSRHKPLDGSNASYWDQD
jgi:hypothetical protein